MTSEERRDEKLCIPKMSWFSKSMSDAFYSGTTLPFENLWGNAVVKPLTDADKRNYDIIQFSFVMLNEEKKPLLIERRDHFITRGFSILQSCSPYSHESGLYPRSLDDIRFYFENEVECESSDYSIDLFGIARNFRKEITYYFYIFRVDFHANSRLLSLRPKIIKTNIPEDDRLVGLCDVKSAHQLLEGNKVDLLVMSALFPEFHVSQGDVEGCNLLVNSGHNLHDILFTTKVEIRPKYIAEAEKDWVRVCLVQLIFSEYYLRPPNEFGYILKDKNEIRKKVFTALKIAKNEGVNIICYPEISFDKEWIKEIKDLYQDMIIIGGSYYESGFNICQVIFDGNTYPIQKANPSPNYEKKLGKRGMKQGKENFVFETKYGRFAVLICYDYVKELSKILDNPDEKIKSVDFIFVPECNKDIKTYQTQADADCRKEPYPYILQVNKCIGEKKGGTCVYGMEHPDQLQRYKDDGYIPSDEKGYKLVEAKGEMMLILDLDIRKERKGRRRPGGGSKMNPIGCYVYRANDWIQDKINIWL